MKNERAEFITACNRQDTLTCMLLLQKHPSLISHNGNTSLLIYPVANDLLPVVEYMLCQGEPEGKTDALRHASFLGNAIIVSVLLRHGADPDQKDMWGLNARMYADNGGHGECVRILHECTNTHILHTS